MGHTGTAIIILGFIVCLHNPVAWGIVHNMYHWFFSSSLDSRIFTGCHGIPGTLLSALNNIHSLIIVWINYKMNVYMVEKIELFHYQKSELTQMKQHCSKGDWCLVQGENDNYTASDMYDVYLYSITSSLRPLRTFTPKNARPVTPKDVFLYHSKKNMSFVGPGEASVTVRSVLPSAEDL